MNTGDSRHDFCKFLPPAQAVCIPAENLRKLTGTEYGLHPQTTPTSQAQNP